MHLYQNRFFQIVFSVTFISWHPFILYISTYNYHVEIWGNISFRSDFSAVLVFIFFVALILITPLIESLLKNRIPTKQIPFFHATVLTLIVLIFNLVIFEKHFQFLTKIGIIWSIALLQWFLSKKHNKNA